MTASLAKERELERLDACIQLATLAAYADGRMADEERDVLRECIAVHAKTERHAQIMIHLAALLPREMPPTHPELRATRIEQIMSTLRTPEDRLWAFALAVDVTNAHSGIGVRETQVLIDLVLTLGIDDDAAQRLLQGATERRRALHDRSGNSLEPRKDGDGRQRLARHPCIPSATFA